MDALPVIVLLIILSSISVISVLVGNTRSNKAQKLLNKGLKGGVTKREDRTIGKAQALPSEQARVLSKEERKKLKNEWKQDQASRRRIEEEQHRAKIAEANNRRRMQKQHDYDKRRFSSALKRKYDKEAALISNRANRPINDDTSTTKPLKPQTDKSGWVYVIQDNTTRLYKIGRTKNIERRLKELGVGKSARLIQRKLVADCYAVERAAHQRYKTHRLPQTEYFKLSSAPIIGS